MDGDVSNAMSFEQDLVLKDGVLRTWIIDQVLMSTARVVA